MSKDTPEITDIKITRDDDVYIYVERPTDSFRWLVKKDGSKILQQLYEINYNKYEWRDVEEVSETENEE